MILYRGPAGAVDIRVVVKRVEHLDLVSPLQIDAAVADELDVPLREIARATE
jgi:hypothetical protein